MNGVPRIRTIATWIAVLLAIGLSAQAASARSQSAPYNLHVVDTGHTAEIDVTLDAPLDPESTPPREVDSLDLTGMDQASLNSQDGDLLHADLSLSGTGFLKTVRGVVGVTVRVRKSGTGDLTVEQLHKDLSERWASPAGAPASGSALAKSDIVTIGGHQYSHVETGKEQAKSFATMYSLPLMGDCFVEFLFRFTGSESSPDPQVAVQAHALIDQVMQSVSIKNP